ncbi:hypothetical protein M433DRAFT_147199 [Acidomyces richmondensis BFW]|nr:hypothetical protein M433DRAFT_147199 [Acidomyces richmondensis BFW]
MSISVPYTALPMERDLYDSFNLTIINGCAQTQTVGIYQVTSDFTINMISHPIVLSPGAVGLIQAPFYQTGLRLSAKRNQWVAQTLFEFGYSTWSNLSGTAYDLSVMPGSELGISVKPSNPNCPSKTCLLDNCPLDQGWTNPDQVNLGSPANSVCYHGITNFEVTFCPSVG